MFLHEQHCTTSDGSLMWRPLVVEAEVARNVAGEGSLILVDGVRSCTNIAVCQCSVIAI